MLILSETGWVRQVVMVGMRERWEWKVGEVGGRCRGW